MSDILPSKRHKKQCSHPLCDRLIDRRSTFCVAHAPRPKPSPETIAKRVEKLRGKKRSPEICAKMSVSAKERANTPEGRARMSKAAKAQTVNPFQGRQHSEESKSIIREKRALQVFSEESIKKHADALRGRPNLKNRGRKHTQEARDKISATLQSKREHLSQKGKERYARETEEQRAKRLIPWIKAGQDNIPRMLDGTSIELFVAQRLDLLGVEYKTQERIGYYIVDFYIPAYKLIIEVNGCFWHGCERCGFSSSRHIAKRRSDQKRYHYLTGKGYIVRSLWEHSIRKAIADNTYDLHLNEWFAIL